MNAENFSVGALMRMAHSPLRNYAIPGLTSYLIGNPSPQGCVRLFHSTRDQIEPIAPHSHRFDFQAWVLSGSVRNRIWEKTTWLDERLDYFWASEVTYMGGAGQYEAKRQDRWTWWHKDMVYEAGSCYSMESHEVHSIYFSKGALVLMFEGPKVSDTSIVLEPDAYGEVVPTFRVEPWMFQRGIKEAA